MAKRLIDKVLEAAMRTIGYGAVVRDWRLIRIHSTHQVVVSVMIMVGKDGPFDVWAIIDLNTEEVFIQE